MRHTRLSRPRTAVTAALAATALLAAPVLAAGGAQADPPRSPSEIALSDIQSDPGKYGVTAADVAELVISDAYTSAHNQVSHVYVRQAKAGTPIAGSSATINVDDKGKVIHTGSRLIRNVNASERER